MLKGITYLSIFMFFVCIFEQDFKGLLFFLLLAFISFKIEQGLK